MLFKLTLLAPVLLLSLSCTEFLRSSKNKEQTFQFEDSQLDCLDSATEVLKNFDSQKTSPDQMKSSLVCFQSSLEYFKAKTKGSVADPDHYTINNLRAFFGKYLGDQSRVSEGLATEMMRLKAALFGGSESKMSKAELQLLIHFVQLIQNEIENLRPYWKMLLMSESHKSYSIEDINIGHSQWISSMSQLLRKTELHKSDYSLSHFEKLLREVEVFVRTQEKKQDTLASWMPLIQATKHLLFGRNVVMGSLDKWNDALRMVSEIYRFYMLYIYQFEPHTMYSKEAIRSGDEILVLSLKLLESSWVIKSTEISFADTQSFFYALEEKKLLPDNITGAAIDETYRAIVTKVLERESRNSNETVIGLNRNHLATLKTEYEIWKSTQNFIDQFPEHFKYEELEAKLKNHRVQTQSVFSVPQPRFILEAWKDWELHLTQAIPLLYTSTGELRLVPHVKHLKSWPWYSLARLNVMRTLARSLMLGYGINRTSIIANEKLNEQSLIDWYSDYGKLGVEIKAFDPRSGNSGSRSFFEANLFTMAGNGDDVLDRQEVFEFINIIFSSGLSGLTQIQKHMLEQGCQLQKKDIMGNNWIREKCFKDQLRKNFSKFFNNLSGLHYSVSQMNNETWDQFYLELMSFSKNPENSPDEIETSDLRTLVVILHYIESMYIQFDLNRDDQLSKAELILASDRFVGFFKTMFKLKSQPNTLEDRFYKYAVSQGFACMVLTGKMPSLSSCTKVFLQDAWENRYSDRLRILKTLNQLKVQVQ